MPQGFPARHAHPRRVNGSTRWAARMNATMMRTPIANNTACTMCALVSSRPSRIASAQPPANAAPNTSAPIKIAAEITVTTLGQTISLLRVEAGCMLMEWVLFRGRNLSEKCRSIKRKRPKNAVSRDIDGVDLFEAKTGNCDVKYHGNGSNRQPAPEAVADAVRDAALRRHQARAFPARLRAGLCRSRR